MSDLSGELSHEDESYAIANLSPRMTGLSRHASVSPRVGSHDVRIKVSLAPGKNTLPVDCAVIGLRPVVHHIIGPTLPVSWRKWNAGFPATCSRSSIIGKAASTPASCWQP